MRERAEGKEYAVCAGVDWATDKHDVALVGPNRKVLKHRQFAHSGEGLAEMANWLIEMAGGDPSRIAVGIEITRGAVVETLLARGIDVFAINPKQSDRFRDRYTMPGSKNDELDSIVLADCLWTDRHLYRQLSVDHADAVELRGVVRTDGQISEDLTRLGSQLRALLSQYFVQVLDIAAIDDKWMWELLQRAPTPAAMRQLKRSTITAILKKHRIRRIDADGVRAALTAPDMTVAPGVWEAVAYQVRVLVETLAFRSAQRRAGERRMAAILDRMEPAPSKAGSDRTAGDSPFVTTAKPDSATPVAQQPSAESERPSDATILLSVPGLGLHCAATFLAEAAGPLAERNYPALRALAGVAPVTKQSGRREHVVRRLACNNRLRNAVHHFASNSARHDPRSAAFLQRKLNEGCEYNRALRGLGDRLLKMIVAMLESGVVYDHTRRGVPPRDVEATA